MRINPSDEALRENKPSPEMEAHIRRITRLVAIIVAFAGTYFFLIKIMFL